MTLNEICKDILFEEDITVMEWLAQTPDRNLIEYVWKLLNERAKEKNICSVKELWTNLQGEWEKMSVDKFVRVAKEVKLSLKVKVNTSITNERYFHLNWIYPL